MPSVSVNAPKTPVTAGSTGIAAATLPNICKMPGPPAPFVPTPLPNIGKSGMSPQGYSTSVQIEGNAVAIAGASFGSMGDIASKALGGGLVSMNCEGPTSFLAPGSLTVQIEGKNVQLLGDQMFNNNGPSGSPPNAATMQGLLQAAGIAGTAPSEDLDCGEVGEYGDQKDRTGHGKYHRDHIPSKAALKERAAQLKEADLTDAEAKAIENGALSIVIPASAHRGVSPTYGGRNQRALIEKDADGLQAAAKRDTAEMNAQLEEHADSDCVKAYKKAAKKIASITDEEYDAFLWSVINP
jgi:uncharacterized Zn-binding protein involved in type VI secretion